MLLWVAGIILISYVLYRLIIVHIIKIRQRKSLSLPRNALFYTIGFFHPYCSAGGGGERVLWRTIQAIQEGDEKALCIVYTGDIDKSSTEILNLVKAHFGIIFKKEIQFVFLRKRTWIDDRSYPQFTLILQSLGAVVLALEASFVLIPDVFCDTMGYAFTYPLMKYIFGCSCVAYVHYPTISTDMLLRVKQGEVEFNNNQAIAKSPFLSSAKFVYYQMFAVLYGVVGSCADVVMVNSSWTLNHIIHLWNVPSRTFLVYPSCNVEELMLYDTSAPREKLILSIAQFRPEKNHQLQIDAFELFCKTAEGSDWSLVMIGSVRGLEDEKRAQFLKNYAKEKGLNDRIHVIINASLETLRDFMQKAKIGLHTMTNEHFGIGIIECMAAGMIMVAHASAGPLEDIVVPSEGPEQVGFLANEADQYSLIFKEIAKMSNNDLQIIIQNARSRLRRMFTESAFDSAVLKCLFRVIPRHKKY